HGQGGRIGAASVSRQDGPVSFFLHRTFRDRWYSVASPGVGLRCFPVWIRISAEREGEDMASVREQNGRKLDELLSAVQRRAPAELTEFQRRLAAWRRKSGPHGPDPSAGSNEEALLAQIEENSALPPGQQRRFERLRRRRQAERLTKSEQKELQALWRRVEEM